MTGQETPRSTGTDGGSIVDRPDRVARQAATRVGGPTGPAQSDRGGPRRARAYEFATKTPPVARREVRGTAVEPLSG